MSNSALTPPKVKRGRTPFGFRRDHQGSFVPNKAEQLAIDEILARREHGQSIYEISRALEARGIRLSSTGVALIVFDYWGRRAPKTTSPVPPSRVPVEA
jgi:hypothetical protein